MKKLIYTLPLLLGLAACSNDDLKIDNQPVPQDGAFYLTFEVENLATPGTKADNYTEGNGDSNQQVDAADNENLIDDVTLFFIGNDKDNDNDNYEKVLLALDATTVKQKTDDKTKHNVEVKLSGAAVLSPICGKKVALILAANKTDDAGKGANGFTYTLTNSGDAAAAQFTAAIGDGEIIQKFGTAGQKMPMVSYEKTAFSTFEETTYSENNIIPILDKFVDGYESISTEGGTGRVVKISEGSSIQLERAVARIDFADRSDSERTNEMGSDKSNLKYCYKLGDSFAIVKMINMEVKNLSSSSYLFRHVINGNDESAFGGTSTDEILLGKENGGVSGSYNWVSNPDWGTSPFEGARTLLSDDSYLKIDPSTLTSTYTNQTQGYYPWVYVTETTVPTTALMAEDNMKKYGVGVEFTFQVMNAAGTEAVTLSNYETTGLPEGVKVINGDQDTKYVRIMRTNGYYRDVELTATGAFIQYTGWLKHNNKSKANVGTEFDPMGLGVVRNNVYQCKVTGIGTKDWTEAQDLYLQLDVQVKQWQKRQNDFEF